MEQFQSNIFQCQLVKTLNLPLFTEHYIIKRFRECGGVSVCKGQPYVNITRHPSRLWAKENEPRLNGKLFCGQTDQRVKFFLEIKNTVSSKQKA